MDSKGPQATGQATTAELCGYIADIAAELQLLNLVRTEAERLAREDRAASLR
jgi:hypothetical protein